MHKFDCSAVWQLLITSLLGSHRQVTCSSPLLYQVGPNSLCCLCPWGFFLKIFFYCFTAPVVTATFNQISSNSDTLTIHGQNFDNSANTTTVVLFVGTSNLPIDCPVITATETTITCAPPSSALDNQGNSILRVVVSSYGGLSTESTIGVIIAAPVAPTDSQLPPSSDNSAGIIGGVVGGVGGAALIAGLIIAVLVLRRRQKRKNDLKHLPATVELVLKEATTNPAANYSQLDKWSIPYQDLTFGKKIGR